MCVSRLPPLTSGIRQIQADFLRYQLDAFGQRQPQFFALELAGECGELANLEKKLWRDSEKEIDFDHLSEEAADVVISVINYANSRGIDLEEAVSTKLRKIEVRRTSGKMGKIRDSSD